MVPCWARKEKLRQTAGVAATPPFKTGVGDPETLDGLSAPEQWTAQLRKPGVFLNSLQPPCTQTLGAADKGWLKQRHFSKINLLR